MVDSGQTLIAMIKRVRYLLNHCAVNGSKTDVSYQRRYLDAVATALIVESLGRWNVPSLVWWLTDNCERDRSSTSLILQQHSTA